MTIKNYARANRGKKVTNGKLTGTIVGYYIDPYNDLEDKAEILIKSEDGGFRSNSTLWGSGVKIIESWEGVTRLQWTTMSELTLVEPALDFTKITTDELQYAVDEQKDDYTCHGIDCSACPFDDNLCDDDANGDGIKLGFRQELARRKGAFKMSETIKTHAELIELHGKSVTCEIKGKTITNAKIAVEGSKVYICQNQKDGNEAVNTLGYKYSWIISRGRSRSYESYDYNTTNIKLADDSNEMPEIVAGNIIELDNGELQLCLPSSDDELISYDKDLKGGNAIDTDEIIAIYIYQRFWLSLQWLIQLSQS